MNLTEHLAQRLRALRDAQGLSLDALAERSGVSRSNISLIERGQSSPTAVVLDKLATALGLPLAGLFESAAPCATQAPVPLARVADQAVWTDPASGYQRRHLSPAVASPLQLVEVLFPPQQRVAYETATREPDIYQQVWVLEGCMDISVGPQTWNLQAGDCLAMQLSQPIVFFNPKRKAARYVVALVTLPFLPNRRTI